MDDVLKKIFPLSFKFTKDVSSLIIGILIYLGIGIGGEIVSAILAFLAIGFILMPIVALYVLAGIVILFLVFFKVIKPEEGVADAAAATEAEATETAEATEATEE